MIVNGGVLCGSDILSTPDSVEAECVCELLSGLYANIALIRLQQKQYRDVISAAEAALLFDPKHVKQNNLAPSIARVCV